MQDREKFSVSTMIARAEKTRSALEQVLSCLSYHLVEFRGLFVCLFVWSDCFGWWTI